MSTLYLLMHPRIPSPSLTFVRSGGLFVLVRMGISRLSTDGLGDLVRVVAARRLELLDEGDVLLLGLLGGDALVDDLLPRVLLGLALYVGGKRMVSDWVPSDGASLPDKIPLGDPAPSMSLSGCRSVQRRDRRERGFPPSRERSGCWMGVGSLP